MEVRNTPQKALILKAISGKGCHHTADEVLALVQQSDPGIGLATVYRNLNRFVEEGKIQKISGEGWSYYDGNPIPHDHLHCQVCGRIFDLPQTYDEQADRRAEKLSGAGIRSHSTTYEGTCIHCIKKNSQSREKGEKKA